MQGARVRAGACGALVLLVPLSGLAQDDPRDRIVAAVRSAMAPALPFPNSDEDGAVPANGNTEALWMVRPLQPGDRSIEVIANPLNEVNQLRATRAMAQIENNIQAAQRRAALQYDRAVSEAKRTGRSQEVDGVTLADEGVAGAKIDAESHVTIDVAVKRAVVHVRGRLVDSTGAVNPGRRFPARSPSSRCRRTPTATATRTSSAMRKRKRSCSWDEWRLPRCRSAQTTISR